MIRIDLWGGELHQTLMITHEVTSWKEAAQIIETHVEAGMLANVLHLDYSTPETAAQMLKEPNHD